MADDPHLLHPDHLPTPFTAEEIRAACGVGRTLRFRVEVAGEEPVVQVTRYVENDPEGGVQESWRETLDGRRVSDPERERSTWLELQEHASFSSDVSERAEETIDIRAGRFVCLRYTRRSESGVWRFWFARDLPGQPVRYEMEMAGRVGVSVVLLGNLPGSAPS